MTLRYSFSTASTSHSQKILNFDHNCFFFSCYKEKHKISVKQFVMSS